MPSAAIAILNWNGRELLQKFLPSVVSYSGEASIYIIDNGSTDDSVDFVQKNYPTVNVIQNGENLGFAGGYNKGLANLKEEIFVLLNSDVEVTPSWLTEPLGMMEKSKDLGALQPLIRSWWKKDHFEHAGAAGGFLDKDYFPFCRGRIFDHVEIDQGQYNKTIDLAWATGACLFVKREVFELAGGFDPDFFAHMEEIDLCLRIKRAGFRISIAPQSNVYHLGGGALAYENPRKIELNFRNNLYLIVKHHHSSPLFFKLFRRMALDGIAAIQFLIKGQFKKFRAIFRAHMGFYGSVSAMMQKRKQLSEKFSKNLGTGFYRRSIVWDFYFQKKRTYQQLNSDRFN